MGLKDTFQFNRKRRLPEIADLIISNKSQEPSHGYPQSHGLSTGNAGWKTWWLTETANATQFNWTPDL